MHDITQAVQGFIILTAIGLFINGVAEWLAKRKREKAAAGGFAQGAGR